MKRNTTVCPQHGRFQTQCGCSDDQIARLLEESLSLKSDFGSRFIPVLPGVIIGCMAPEARDLLMRVMEAWGPHLAALKKSNGDDYEPGHYGFAYWLIRWSGLVAPSMEPKAPSAACGSEFSEALEKLLTEWESKPEGEKWTLKLNAVDAEILNSQGETIADMNSHWAARRIVAAHNATLSGQESKLIENIWKIIADREHPEPETAAFVPRESLASTLRTLLMAAGYEWEKESKPSATLSGDTKQKNLEEKDAP